MSLIFFFKKCNNCSGKMVDNYCIEGISETPNASADFYCQSNTNNRTWTLCAFYVKSSKVNHRQNTQKERARYCEMGRGGREKRWRERVWRWFLLKIVILVFDHRPKSTWDILRYRYWSYLHKVILRCLQILKSLVRRYFYFPTVFLVLMTSARITQMFSTLPPCIKLCASRVLDAERKCEIF